MPDRIVYFEQLRARADANWLSFYDSQLATLRGDDPPSKSVGPVVNDPPSRPQWRANNEPAWAALFTALGVVWRYEAIEPKLSKSLGYIPDFWLAELDTWIEIKSGIPSAQDIGKARRLLAATGERVYLLSGWPGRRQYKAYLFTEAGEFVTQRPDWSNLALCTLFDVSFDELWTAFGKIKKGYRK